MSQNGRKRSHSDLEDGDLGLGATLAHMKNPSDNQQHGESEPRTAASDGHEGDWQEVKRHRSRKRPKRNGDYPSISHSSHARLQSFVKLDDLQGLILYLLADGTSPRWCSVKNHQSVRRVVAVMVPGLEKGMFNRGIPLLSPGEMNGAYDAVSGISTDTGDLAHTQRNSSHTLGPDLSVARALQQSAPHTTTSTSPDDYYPTKLHQDQLPTPLQPLSEIFEHLWPVKTPGDGKFARMHSPLAATLIAPLAKSQQSKNSKGPQPPTAGKHWHNERTAITEFVASTQELVDGGYVLHPAHHLNSEIASTEIEKRKFNKATHEHGWVDTPNIADLAAGEIADTSVEQGSILRGRKILAIDCEMCITSPAGTTPQVFSLTRISIIDWNGNVVLDELVKPEEPITDYLTPYSGITASMLENITTSLSDIQTKLLKDLLTPHTILIGHSLESDLNALKLTHPFMIDTSILFPHPRGPPLKSSLKWLSQKYLSREIQKGHGSTGHDSVEDAKACLDLVKQKCEKGKAWGTSEASGEPIFKRIGRHARPAKQRVNAADGEAYRTGAVVDWGEPKRGHGAHARVALGCESDGEVVEGVKRALEGDGESSLVPKGGVDFVFARLRELEAYRGWWNRSKTVDNEVLRNSTISDSNSETLTSVISNTVARIQEIWDSLPPCTAFIVFSGSGDPRELAEMQDLQKRFKEEYKVKKWDDLSVKWTDVEEQRLRAACEKARLGIGFLTVK